MTRNAIKSYFRTSKMTDRSEMVKNTIESDFQTSKMATEKKMKWPELLSKVNFRYPKWTTNIKWPEMQSKVIFEHQKCPPAAILYLSKMARNAIKSEFRTSKMADGSHFVKNL